MYPTKVKNIDIPVGVTVAVDVLSLHYDPQYWGPEDPNKFYPLRCFNVYNQYFWR
jgi:hypothetical protein